MKNRLCHNDRFRKRGRGENDRFRKRGRRENVICPSGGLNFIDISSFRLSLNMTLKTSDLSPYEVTGGEGRGIGGDKVL